MKDRIRELKQPIFCFFSKVFLPLEEDDTFLVKVVRPLVSKAVGPDGFRYFFFIRYSEDGYHLRLRFFGDRSAVLGAPRESALGALEDAVKASSTRKLEVDRYRPEGKRYGGEIGVRLAERLFSASSRAVLDFLELRESGSTEVSKVEFAFASGEALLEAIGLTPEERAKLFTRKQLPANPTTEQIARRQSLDEMSAVFAPIVRRVVSDPKTYWTDQNPALQRITDTLYDEVRPWFADRKTLQKSLKVPLFTLASSYLHMHYNRLGLFPAEESVIRYSRGGNARITS